MSTSDVCFTCWDTESSKSRKSLFIGLSSSVLSDISVFVLQNLLTCAFEWYGLVCNLEVIRLRSSQTWLLDVRDLNSMRNSFQKPAQMKIHPHYSWHQTGLGAQSGLICSWMWEAVETVACLACVCVAEVVEGRRRRGHQWATAGVPQSQPFTCCYHSWHAGPRPGTNSLSLTEVEAVDSTDAQTLLPSCLLLHPPETKLSACFYRCCLSCQPVCSPVCLHQWQGLKFQYIVLPSIMHGAVLLNFTLK